MPIYETEFLGGKPPKEIKEEPKEEPKDVLQEPKEVKEEPKIEPKPKPKRVRKKVVAKEPAKEPEEPPKEDLKRKKPTIARPKKTVRIMEPVVKSDYIEPVIKRVPKPRAVTIKNDEEPPAWFKKYQKEKLMRKLRKAMIPARLPPPPPQKVEQPPPRKPSPPPPPPPQKIDPMVRRMNYLYSQIHCK